MDSDEQKETMVPNVIKVPKKDHYGSCTVDQKRVALQEAKDKDYSSERSFNERTEFFLFN